MNIILTIFQIIIALSLMTVILMQSKGSGLGTAFGAAGGTFSTKRGVEKLLFQVTLVLAALFLLIPLSQLIFSN